MTDLFPAPLPFLVPAEPRFPCPFYLPYQVGAAHPTTPSFINLLRPMCFTQPTAHRYFRIWRRLDIDIPSAPFSLSLALMPASSPDRHLHQEGRTGSFLNGQMTADR